MKDYYFYMFKKTEYSLEYLDSLDENELEDYFNEQTWDDEEGVINEDKCTCVPFDQFAGMCNAGMLNPSEWWMYLIEVDNDITEETEKFTYFALIDRNLSAKKKREIYKAIETEPKKLYEKSFGDNIEGLTIIPIWVFMTHFNENFIDPKKVEIRMVHVSE